MLDIGTDSYPNAVESANITLTGILAHESALEGGERTMYRPGPGGSISGSRDSSHCRCQRAPPAFDCWDSLFPALEGGVVHRNGCLRPAVFIETHLPGELRIRTAAVQSLRRVFAQQKAQARIVPDLRLIGKILSYFRERRVSASAKPNPTRPRAEGSGIWTTWKPAR